MGAGLCHTILFLLATWLISSGPGPRASDSQIIEFYERGDQRRLLLFGLYVMPFAGIAFIWFIVALRTWISEHLLRGHMLMSNIQLVSGILYVGLFFTAGAAEGATSASVQFTDAPIDPVLARQFPQFGSTIILIFAMRMAAMFVFSTSSIARSTKVLPSWFTYSGYVVGLFLLLSATFSKYLILVFPTWLLVLCILMMIRVRQIPADGIIRPASSGKNQLDLE